MRLAPLAALLLAWPAWAQERPLLVPTRDVSVAYRASGREEGRAEGRAEGEAEGIRKGKLDMARGMLRDGLPIEMIMKYSGLLKDEIEHLHTK